MNVGEAFITPTYNASHPFLLYCPTMRVPYNISGKIVTTSLINYKGTDNAYKAMKTALTCLH